MVGPNKQISAKQHIQPAQPSVGGRPQRTPLFVTCLLKWGATVSQHRFQIQALKVLQQPILSLVVPGREQHRLGSVQGRIDLFHKQYAPDLAVLQAFGSLQDRQRSTAWPAGETI